MVTFTSLRGMKYIVRYQSEGTKQSRWMISRVSICPLFLQKLARLLRWAPFIGTVNSSLAMKWSKQSCYFCK